MLVVHYVYIIQCSDATLYTGYAKNVQKRVEEHNSSSKGAKYTRPRRPVTLRYVEEYETRSEACKRESVIKKMTRKEKETLINEISLKMESD